MSLFIKTHRNPSCSSHFTLRLLSVLPRNLGEDHGTIRRIVGKERRLAERHELKTQVRLRVRRSNLCEQEVKSENISRRGVFFTTDLPLTEGTILDLLLEMPEAISGVRAAHWNCMGHVVRVVPAESETDAVGIGVEFDFMWCRMKRSSNGLRGRTAWAVEAIVQ